ncbi:helix-turn-helix domain-containing protein [Rhodobacteraceae bacterium F11138]|nr:helix-turn-helix domain-containing protein [Rhodobacteraceae bacterium F11138]
MSFEVIALVKKRSVGSPTRKSVFMYLADCASEDGSGCWTSKGHIAADLELSKRTVQNCFDDLQAANLIFEVGKRSCANGYTLEYAINLEAVRALPSTRKDRDQISASPSQLPQKSTGAGDSPVQEIHPTGAGDSPHGVQEIHPNRSGTVQEPCVAEANTHIPDCFEEFWEKHPRPRFRDKTRQIFTDALRAGVDPCWIIQSAMRYAGENKSNSPQYIAYSDNWLVDRRWEDFEEPSTASVTSNTAGIEGTARMYAEKILGRAYIPQSAITSKLAKVMIEMGMVTVADLRAAGLQ